MLWHERRIHPQKATQIPIGLGWIGSHPFEDRHMDPLLGKQAIGSFEVDVVEAVVEVEDSAGVWPVGLDHRDLIVDSRRECPTLPAACGEEPIVRPGAVHGIAQRGDHTYGGNHFGDSSHGASPCEIVRRGLAEHPGRPGVGELGSIPVNALIKALGEELELLGSDEDIWVFPEIAIKRRRSGSHGPGQ